MAITFAALGSGADTAAGDPFTTATSITPSANALVLLAIAIPAAAVRTVSSVVGNSLTWVEVTNITYNTIAAPTYNFALWRSMGASPSSGTLVIDFSGAVQGCAWSAVEFSGVDQTGTNGSGAIVQSATARHDSTGNTSELVTLAAFGSADNATYGAFMFNRNENATPGSGFTEAHDLGHVTPAVELFTEYLLGNDTTVDVTWTTAGASGGIAVEIKAAAAGGWVFGRSVLRGQAVTRASYW